MKTIPVKIKSELKYALVLENIHCPCNGQECPIVVALNEKLKTISQFIKDIEKNRLRKQSPRNAFKPEDILNIRTKYRLTQQNLAHILGVNVATVNRWEQGTVIPADKAQDKLQNLKKLGVRQVRILLAQKTPGLDHLNFSLLE